MSVFKKIMAVVICLVMVITVVACNTNGGDTTTSKETVETTTKTTSTTSVTDVTTKQEETDVTTETTLEETTTGKDPVVYVSGYDPIDELVGTYVTLQYNPMYCSVKTEVTKGLGSNESVKLTVTMKDGYIFDGWTQLDYLCNLPNYSDNTKPDVVAKRNAISESVTLTETYSLSVNSAVNVYVNCSMKVVYDANGGKTTDGKTTMDTTFCVSEYKCPSTLPDKGYFSREGYVLSEYNTKADGTGTAVSLGSKIRSDSSTLTLYCIWLKTNESSDFTFSSGAITGYKGTAKDVVIPETINGQKVTSIKASAFKNKDIETVFIPKTVTTVEAKAFDNCQKLNTVVFFDNVTFSDSMMFGGGSFESCPNLKNARINAVYDMYYVGWISGTYCKTDRLVWAQDMPKFVIYGGSGSLYGFDCSQIDAVIGGSYVVINMGANANSSAAFVFEGMQKYLNEGDIVLWDPEPGNFTLGQAQMSGRGVEFYICGNYDFLKGVDISKYAGFFSSISSINSSHKSQSTSWECGSIGYNCYGDCVSNRDFEDRECFYNFAYFGWYDYSRMSAIIDEFKANGIEVWFTYAVMDEECGGVDNETVDEYIANIKKNFDVTIISDFYNCFVPHEYRWNSEWHLTDEGAVYRTEKLLPDILDQFEKSGKKY